MVCGALCVWSIQKPYLLLISHNFVFYVHMQALYV